VSDRLCDTCGDYKELCGHEYLYAEIKRLKAENQRLREIHKSNVDEDTHSRIMRSSHFCEWRTSFEAVIERSKAALLQEDKANE